MQGEIPIIVTRKGRKGPQMIFTIQNLYGIKLLKHRRQNTIDKNKRQEVYNMPKHQTLDTDKQFQRIIRTKRISSSGASKRFPKDFFKNEEWLMPIKSNKIKSKYIEPTEFLQTFNKNQFKTITIKDQQSKLKSSQIEQIRLQKEASRIQTPKFKHRHDNLKNDILRMQDLNQKTKIKEYLSYKRLQDAFPSQINERANIYRLNFESKKNSLTNYKQTNQNNDKKNNVLNVQPMPPLVSNFNLTLGKKNSLLCLIKKQQDDKQKNVNSKRIQKINENNMIDSKKIDEKENNYEVKKISPHSNLMTWLWQKQMKNEMGGGFRIRRHVLN